MFFNLLSFIIPVISAILITVFNFHPFYSEAELFLLLLCTAGAAIAAMTVAPIKPACRIWFSVTPALVLLCLAYNFIVTAFIIAITFIIALFIPSRRVKKRIIFTQDNTPVILACTRTGRIRSYLARISTITLFSSAVLFAASCIFATPTVIWNVRAFPINLTQKPIYADMAVPSGEVTCTIGYDGAAILVDSFTAIETESGTLPSPAESAGMKKGDVITKINNQPAKFSDFLTLGPDGTTAKIEAARLDEQGRVETVTFEVTPCYSAADDKYMIGILYYDAYMLGMYSTVQTMSFTYPEKGFFAATAHSSEMENDSEHYTHALKAAHVNGRDDTGLLATPGKDLGEIVFTNRFGSFGVWHEDNTKSLPIAKKSDLKLGRATVLSSFEGDGVKEYEAYVTGTYRIDSRDVICLIVTDERVIAEGGITRGMSGSPIIQNGKIIGALSNTDSKGYCSYATFAYDMAHEIYLAQNMLEESAKEVLQ